MQTTDPTRFENRLSFTLWIVVAVLWLFVALFASGCVPPNVDGYRRELRANAQREYDREEADRHTRETIQQELRNDHVLRGDWP